MIFHYLKISFRFLSKNRLSVLINFFGLSISIISAGFIFLWISGELSFNKGFPNYPNIYRIITTTRVGREIQHSAYSGTALSSKLMEDFAEIRSASSFYKIKSEFLKFKEQGFTLEHYYYVDTSVFTIFPIVLVSGNPKEMLASTNSIVITQSIAKKYFGEENPIGNQLIGEFGQTYFVTGVMKDLPVKSSLKVDAFRLNYHTDSWKPVVWNTTYILLDQNVNVRNFEKKISFYLKKYGYEKRIKLSLQSLKKIHLRSASINDFEKRGSILLVYSFSLLGILLLVIASINFINLSFGYSVKRSREVGFRKVLGAKGKDLAIQFIGESLILSFFSLIFSVFLIKWLMPFFNDFFGTTLHLDLIHNFKCIVGLTGFAFVNGIISGLYPSFYLSRLNPVKVLKERNISGIRYFQFKKILLVFQFFFSTGLIVCTLIIYKQFHFLVTKDLMIDTKSIIYTPLHGNFRYSFASIKDELLKNPHIEVITSISGNPLNFRNSTSRVSWEGKEPDESIIMDFEAVDEDFFDIFKVSFTQGSFVPRKIGIKEYLKLKYSTEWFEYYVVNEEAIKQIGLKNPIGKKISINGRKGIITGVFSNFHFKPLQSKIEPLSLVYDPEGFHNLFIKIKAENINETIDFIKTTILKFDRSDHPFTYVFLSDDIQVQYKNEKVMVQVFLLFAFLAILLSSFGLFAHIYFDVIGRTKEIAIRKVNGATSDTIVRHLFINNLKIISISCFIAWPISYFLMNNWLKNFAYKVENNFYYYLLAGIIVVIISLLTILYHTIKASKINPSITLKYE